MDQSEKQTPENQQTSEPGQPGQPGQPGNTWEKIAVFAFGVIFIGFMLGLAVFIPNPTGFQIFVFRVVLALAASGIGAVVPGLLHVEWKPRRLPYIRAGGAVALFVIVYSVNPPALINPEEVPRPVKHSEVVPAKPAKREVTPEKLPEATPAPAKPEPVKTPKPGISISGGVHGGNVIIGEGDIHDSQ